MQPLPERDLVESSEHSGGFWPMLDGRRLLFTGMTGPFGVWLLSVLDFLQRTQGLTCSITALSRDPKRFQLAHPELLGLQGLSWVQGDIRNLDLRDAPYDYVIHGATTRALDTYLGASPAAKFDTVVRGTQRLIRSLPQGDETRLLLVSSGSVYGTSLLREGSRIPEAWPEVPPMTPGAALGHAKRAAEFLVLAAQEERRDISSSIARCFSFVGPALPTDIHYAIGNFVSAAVANRDLVVRTNGTASRSYMYLGDMVAWLMGILVKGAPGSTFHVGSEKRVTIRDLAYLVREVTNSQSRVIVQGMDSLEPGTSAANSYVPDTSQTRATLGLSEWTSLEEGIARSATFLRTSSV